MPRSKEASFEPACFRWTKMINGVRFQTTCKKLGVPRSQWTETGSKPAANEYFRELQREIEGLEAECRFPETLRLKAQVHALRLRGQLARFIGHTEYATNRSQLADAIEGRIEVDTPEQVQEILDEIPKPSYAEAVGMELMARHAPTLSPATSVWQRLDDFLAEEKSRLLPGSYKDERSYYLKLKCDEVFPEGMEVDEINQTTVSNHFTWLSATDWKSKNKYLGFFRKFIKWLYENGPLEALPKNLKSNLHKFKKSKEAIEEYDPQEVAACVKALPSDGQYNFKLWALLALNCSITQVDFSQLCWWDKKLGIGVNLDKGTLTRFRVKTEAHENAPLVTYKLWSETLAELEKIKHRTGLLFTTSNLKPLYTSFYDDDGEPKKKDMVTCYWGRDCEPKPPISFGQFRSIGSAQLKKSHIYRQYVEVWLADTPKGMAHIHYSPEDWERFGEACLWIRECLFGANGERLKPDEAEKPTKKKK